MQIFLKFLFDLPKALLKSHENINLTLIGYINVNFKNVLNSGFINLYKPPDSHLCGYRLKYVI